MNKFYNQFEIIARKFPNNNAIIYCNNSHVIDKLLYKDLLCVTEIITINLQKHVGKYVCIGILTLPNPLLPIFIISTQKAHLAFFCFDFKMAGNEILNLANTLGINIILSGDPESSMNIFYNKCYTLLYEETFFNYVVKLWRINDIKVRLYKDISYVIQTSGTTGTNKIVKVFHNCIISNINCLRNIFEINTEDIIYMGTPITFDPFIIELMLALTSGASLLFVEYQIKRNNILLLETLFPKNSTLHSGVTIIQMVPSVFLCFPKKEIDKLIYEESSLRILALGGEKFPDQLTKYEDRSRKLRIFNLYGITEISCWASIEEIKEKQFEVSIGEPLDETVFQLRNSDGTILQCGEGELYIGSSSRICIIDDEEIPDDGKIIYRSTGDIVYKDEARQKIYYLGRKNDVIKRFGHRISLCEIEKIVLSITNLNSICIWDVSKSKLILFVILKETDKIIQRKIIDRLRIKFLHSLSKSSNPDIIELIPAIPLTANGKIDKNCLLNISNIGYTSSDHNPREVFQHLWSKYFGISIHNIESDKYHNFSNQGGNSVLAIQLISEYDAIIQNTYSNKLMAMLFDTTKSYSDYISLINDESKLRKLQNIKRSIDSTTLPQNDAKIPKLVAHSSKIDSARLNVRWKYNLEACVDATPVYFEHPRLGEMVTVGCHSHIFVTLNALSGKVISKTILQDAIENAACITVCKQYAIVGCNDSYIYRIQIETGNTVWKYKSGSSIKCVPAECDGNIIFGSYDKTLYCIRLTDATHVWQVLLNGSIKSSPIIHVEKKKVYVATILGGYYCICQNTGMINWKYETDVPIFGSPCLISDENLIVWADVKGYVNAFECDNGDKLWTYKAEGFVYSSLSNTRSYLIFGCSDHNIYCLECTRHNCKEMVKIDIGAPISSTPYIFSLNGGQYFISANNKGKLWLFELNSFVLLQVLQLPDDVFSAPVVSNNRIYVGCRDNYLYCIEINIK